MLSVRRTVISCGILEQVFLVIVLSNIEFFCWFNRGGNLQAELINILRLDLLRNLLGNALLLRRMVEDGRPILCR